MENFHLLSALLGLCVGLLGVVYLYITNKKLESTIVDKQTIIKLIRDHGKFDKPKRTYRKRSSKKNTRSVKTAN
jgi:hypothetical protein